MQNTDMITRLNLVQKVSGEQGVVTLFDCDDAQYVVPLYQRAFAWGTESNCGRENEIIQLMDDVMDADPNAEYYLGTLIAWRNGNVYEVIDGQQRLTALFLIFSCIDLPIAKENALSYACRDKSNYSLRRIADLREDESRLERPYEASIYDGIRTIKTKIKSEERDDPKYLEKLRKRFERVVLFRICVPEGTDLNRYFEVMNTRGEQLEQHDIVKASLMSQLTAKEQNNFSEIWNACRDMDGYVQMHFNTDMRREFFGTNWDTMPNEKLLAAGVDVGMSKILKITDVVSEDFKIDKVTDDEVVDTRVRFESIIGFTHFLLHVLKVFVATEKIVSDEEGLPLMDELLDDKKLISAFQRVIDHGLIGGLAVDQRAFARKFILCLLKSRFLFDKFIIKRDYKEDNSDGEWSLKELQVSYAGGSAKPYYAETKFKVRGEWEQTWLLRCENNRVIQSCLRVSYTSPKVMHWITKLLMWLYENGSTNLACLNKYNAATKQLAIEAVRGYLQNGDFKTGVNTPHIVLNFIDYLLWQNKRRELGPFEFEFRNSVEHWYPQNPSEGTFAKWDDVDTLGNLCLVQRNINSKFSNMSPEAKKSTFEEMIRTGSLKLRVMARATQPGCGIGSSENWRDYECAKHEASILQMLKDACGIGTTICE